MFIQKFKKKFKNLNNKKYLILKLLKSKVLIENYESKIKFFKVVLKNFKKIRQFIYILLNMYNLTTLNNIKHKFVNYLINLKLTKYNAIISVNNYKGNTVKVFSLGMLGNKDILKIRNPLTLFKILMFIRKKLRKTKKQKTIAIFKNLQHDSNRYAVINRLKDVFSICEIKNYNLAPHNGCRPKKIRRFKRRKRKNSFNNVFLLNKFTIWRNG